VRHPRDLHAHRVIVSYENVRLVINQYNRAQVMSVCERRHYWTLRGCC